MVTLEPTLFQFQLFALLALVKTRTLITHSLALLVIVKMEALTLTVYVITLNVLNSIYNLMDSL